MLPHECLCYDLTITMSIKTKTIIIGLLFLGVMVSAVLFFQGSNIAVLNPKGTIASQQRDLIWIATGLMLIVVLPVFALTGYISWKYRSSNKKALYMPEWDGSRALELTWWGFPLLIIVILSGIIWRSSHDLDPFKPISSNQQPLTIQVVAMQWKWLFIYPDHNIATVNFIQIPEDTPVKFEITSDAPMNSFWIPQLGGQVYAMSGMETNLNLIANEPGEYDGVSANISGEGFANMRFKTKVSSHDDYLQWLSYVKQSSDALDFELYKSLAEPSVQGAPLLYSSVEPLLFKAVLEKFMHPTADLRQNSGLPIFEEHNEGSH